ncbi:MAG: hypothetical protein ACREV2_02940 [Burkholderiales bacterium]
MLTAFNTISLWIAAVIFGNALAEPVTADVCPQKLATIERLKNELQIARTTTKDHGTRLKELRKSRGEAGKYQVATEAAKVAKPRYEWLKNVGSGLAVARVDQLSVQIEQTESLLRISKEKESSLAKELALEESLAARCLQQAAAAAAATPAFPSVAGDYNSPYGRTVLTQKQLSSGVVVEGTVFYDKSENTPEGGTSRLSGSFDGRTWNYTWYNSYGHHGDGQLTLLDDGTGMKGWWIDYKPKPPQRGNWWLYRK